MPGRLAHATCVCCAPFPPACVRHHSQSPHTPGPPGPTPTARPSLASVRPPGGRRPPLLTRPPPPRPCLAPSPSSLLPAPGLWQRGRVGRRAHRSAGRPRRRHQRRRRGRAQRQGAPRPPSAGSQDKKLPLCTVLPTSSWLSLCSHRVYNVHSWGPEPVRITFVAGGSSTMCPTPCAATTCRATRQRGGGCLQRIAPPATWYPLQRLLLP